MEKGDGLPVAGTAKDSRHLLCGWGRCVISLCGGRVFIKVKTLSLWGWVGTLHWPSVTDRSWQGRPPKGWAFIVCSTTTL